MELDELKQNWNQSNDKLFAPYQLDKVIASKSSGILSKLKAKYKTQAILLPLAAAFLSLAMITKPILQQNAFIWMIIPIMILLALIYYQGYTLISKMEQAYSESLKNAIQKNLSLLSLNTKKQLILIRIILVILILVLEITIYQQTTTAFNFWQDIALPVRMGVYALLILAQPYFTRYIFEFSFGRYIKELRQLLDQTE